MKQNTVEILLGVSALFFMLSITMLYAVYNKPTNYPKCEDYGYKRGSVLVIDQRTKILKIQCTGEPNGDVKRNKSETKERAPTYNRRKT